MHVESSGIPKQQRTYSEPGWVVAACKECSRLDELIRSLLIPDFDLSLI